MSGDDRGVRGAEYVPADEKLGEGSVIGGEGYSEKEERWGVFNENVVVAKVSR